MSGVQCLERYKGSTIIGGLCELNWRDLTEFEVVCAAWAYYFFSIQFRENLEIACDRFSDDNNLQRLKREECNTANLSPYPQIAFVGEKLDHDEFMRRALALFPIPEETACRFQAGGLQYLQEIRAMSEEARALSIGNYESGGLERLFKAMLQAPPYQNKLVAAFRFFMLEHIRFDSDPVDGHGALSMNITGDEDIEPLWDAFGQMLLEFVPGLQPLEPNDQQLMGQMPPPYLVQFPQLDLET